MRKTSSNFKTVFILEAYNSKTVNSYKNIILISLLHFLRKFHYSLKPIIQCVSVSLIQPALEIAPSNLKTETINETVRQPICRVIFQMFRFETGNFSTSHSFIYHKFVLLKNRSILVSNIIKNVFKFLFWRMCFILFIIVPVKFKNVNFHGGNREKIWDLIRL